MSCSKGNDTIAPIIPSGDYFVEEDQGIIYLDANRDIQESSALFDPQVSPIMPVDIFNEIDNELTAIIGNEKLTEDQLVFLKADPSGLSKHNPPMLYFMFVTTKNAISPDDISVFVDEHDISKHVHYNVNFNEIRNANYYIGFLRPNNYLNPENQHQLNIEFNPQKGTSLQESVNFTVMNDDNLQVASAGFIKDKTREMTLMDKILVSTNIPDHVEPGDRLLQPQNWVFSYDDDRKLPDISSIEKLSSKAYVIHFSEGVDAGENFGILYSPANGINSQRYGLKAPKIPTERGGGVFRRGASSCENCSGDLQEDYKQEAQECASLHHWQITATCPHFVPEGCEGIIEETITKFFYVIPMNWDEEQPDEDMFVAPITGAGEIEYHEYICAGLLHNTANHNEDIIADYELYGYDEEDNQCGLLAALPSIELNSDTEPPSNVEAEFWIEHIDNCANPPCSACSKVTQYGITVSAEDNICVIKSPKFYVYYPFVVDRTIRFIPFVHPDNYYTETAFELRYYIQDVNIFACAEYMRIVVRDRKGNWRAKRMEKMGAGVPIYDTQCLPYPSEIELRFDERLPGGQGGNHKQYVNLNHRVEEEKDEQVCAYKMVVETHPDSADNFHVNHGPEIYMDVVTTPPLANINIKVEYIDPPFTHSDNDEPTNNRGFDLGGGCDQTLSDDDCASDNNCSMEIEEFFMLWGSHFPYAGDYRTLGDNWNYFYDKSWGNSFSECEPEFIANGVPVCDPIRTREGLPQALPCFERCNVPPLTFCLDIGCEAYEGSINLTTNLHGKKAIYLNAMSHGGDNFMFRASTNNPQFDLINCLFSEPTDKFTIWRKIYMNYAYMEDRGDSYPDCDEISEEDEYDDIHHINNGDFSDIIGVFDDCFIEIEPHTHYENTPYWPFMICYPIHLVPYGDYTHFRDPPQPHDSLVLLGIDHLSGQCPIIGEDGNGNLMYGAFGTCVDHWNPIVASDAFYTFVAVGNIHDWFEIYDKYPLDQDYTDDPDKEVILTAVQEITHCLSSRGDEMDDEYTYGIMASPDERSYLHSGHIISLRIKVPKFDDEY